MGQRQFEILEEKIKYWNLPRPEPIEFKLHRIEPIALTNYYDKKGKLFELPESKFISNPKRNYKK